MAVPAAHHPEHTYYEASLRSSGPVVIHPDGTWIEGFASLEHAQSFAFEMNAYLREPLEWMEAWKARRPDPSRVRSFFTPDRVLSVEELEERLLALINREWMFERIGTTP